MEESAWMRDRACETDSHQDGVGSEAEAEAEGDGEAAPAPVEDGEGGMAADGGGEAEMRSLSVSPQLWNGRFGGLLFLEGFPRNLACWLETDRSE